MAKVVHLKYGQQPPRGDDFILVLKRDRIRGADFYVAHMAELSEEQAAHIGDDGPGLPSLQSALNEAERLAARCRVDTIYVNA